MATKNLKNNIPSSAAAEKTVKNAKDAGSPSLAKKLKAAQEFGQGAALVILFLLGLLMLILPKAVKTLKALQAAKDELGKKGIRTGKNDWISGIETEGIRADGEEMVECAHEGLRARVKKAKEEKEAEFERRVAVAVKKAQQGQSRA